MRRDFDFISLKIISYAIFCFTARNNSHTEPTELAIIYWPENETNLTKLNGNRKNEHH